MIDRNMSESDRTANDAVSERTGDSEPLVSPSWLSDRLTAVDSDDPDLRLVEVDLNTDFYDEGHVPGAVSLDWQEDLRHDRRRDVLSRDALGELLGDLGIVPDTTVVVYGDNTNWFAAHFYWLLTYYGHDDVRLLDGGREHWIESGRPITTSVPDVSSRPYEPRGPYEDVRAYREDVDRAIDEQTTLVDVRLPAEYEGRLVAPPGMDEYAQRGGHVPSAVNVVWSANVAPSGRFKSREALAELYHRHGVTDQDSVITYCRIGERSSLTWFVLSELLEYPSVMNYDGSWTEWGNMIGAPIETGTEVDEGEPAVPNPWRRLF
jgi:thiosulfate/3-mercaptopyruvate sulfurtransferase